MKKLTAIVAISLIALTTSCANHNGLTHNLNSQNTEVVLSQNNFKVVGSVSGEAEVTYILGIGGLAKNTLVSEARKAMVEKANLNGSAKAIINEKVEIKKSALPFLGKVKATVSAEVIEFTK